MGFLYIESLLIERWYVGTRVVAYPAVVRARNSGQIPRVGYY